MVPMEDAYMWTCLGLSCVLIVTCLSPISLGYDSLVSSLCPATDPCVCHTSAIHCGNRRLAGLPHFLGFSEVWAVLNLSGNFIQAFCTEYLEQIQVTSLLLDNNRIQSVRRGSFAAFTLVQTLDLSHNRIIGLEANVFGSMKQLKHLYIRYNELHVLAADDLSGLPDLALLDFTGNKFSSVPKQALTRVQHIARLLLRDNNIRDIEAFAFSGMTLKDLDLGQNGPFFNLNPKAFCGLEPSVSHSGEGIVEWRGITSIYLDNNRLRHINSCSFQRLWTLNLIDISGNPLLCDCALLRLTQYVPHAIFPNAACASPGRLAGRTLGEISNDGSLLNCSILEPAERKCRDRNWCVTQVVSTAACCGKLLTTELIFMVLIAGVLQKVELFTFYPLEVWHPLKW